MACKRIQDAIAAGKPTKKELAEQGRQRRLARQKAREDALRAKLFPGLTPKQTKKLTEAARTEAVIETTVSLGQAPTPSKVAEVAGISLQKAKDALNGNLVQSTLEKNGITLDLLDTVGKEGLKADAVKLVYDENGNVVDSIAMPDHHARHKFWRDYNMMHGRLGEKDSSTSGGGLIIIAPQDAKVVAGHNAACTCDKCIDAWNEKTKYIAARAARAMAVDAEIIDNPESLPETIPPDDFDDDVDVS